MRCGILICVISIAWVSVPVRGQLSSLSSEERPGFMERVGRVSAPQAMNPVRALLLKRIDGVSWDEQPLSDVIDWLAGQSTESGRVSVVVRWKALNVESIGQDTGVTLTMGPVTVKDVLDEVLDQLSDLDPLTYVGKDNVLKISTTSDFDRKLYTRLYDISEIMIRVQNFTGSPQIDLQQQQQSSGGGGGGQSGQAQVQSIFSGQGGGGSSDDDDDEGDEEEDERADEVMTWIRTVVEPLSWEENGGLGAMAVINKQLAVRNTLSVHELLGGPFHLDE